MIDLWPKNLDATIGKAPAAIQRGADLLVGEKNSELLVKEFTRQAPVTKILMTRGILLKDPTLWLALGKDHRIGAGQSSCEGLRITS